MQTALVYVATVSKLFLERRKYCNGRVVLVNGISWVTKKLNSYTSDSQTVF